MIMLHTLDRIVSMLQALDGEPSPIPVSYDIKSIVARLKPVVSKCTFDMDGVVAITRALFNGELVIDDSSPRGIYAYIRDRSRCFARHTYFYIGISDSGSGSFQLSPAERELKRKWSDYENKFMDFESLIKIMLFQIVGLDSEYVDRVCNDLRS